MSCTKLFGLIDDHDWHYVASEDKNRILNSFELPLLDQSYGLKRLVHHRVCLKCKTIDNQIARFRTECVRRRREIQERDRLAQEIIVASEAEDRKKRLHSEQQDE